MKKIIKNIFLVLVIMIGVITLTGCGKDTKKEEKKEESNTPTIVGTWVYKDSDSFEYTFKKDGTGTYLVGTTEMKFTYETDDNKLSILYDGSTVPFETEYSIKDDVLNIKDSLGEDTLYERK